MALQGIHPLLTRDTKQNIGETVRSNGEAETTIEQRCLTPHPAVPRSIAGWRNTKYRGGGRRTEGLEKNKKKRNRRVKEELANKDKFMLHLYNLLST